MSLWTYIRGMITVEPMGRTQAEKRYILDTVLEHLPRVTGSEKDMHIHVIQRAGHDMSCSSDEFGMHTNNLIGYLGDYDSRTRRGSLQIQTQYFLVLEADLRDRVFEETKKEFLKWLVRLAKRVYVSDVFAEIHSDYPEREWVIRDHWNFGDLCEAPSWSLDDKELSDPNYTGPNWCEFMMWDYGHESDMPMLLLHKYFKDEVNDAEVEHRRNHGGRHWTRQEEWGKPSGQKAKT